MQVLSVKALALWTAISLALSLSVPAKAAENRSVTPDFIDVATAISDKMQQYHYDPSALSDPTYQAAQQKVAKLAATSANREDFVSGFNTIWSDGPFSHVRLSVAQSSAKETAAYFDAMRIGGGGAVLGWEGDIAVLTVNTMMGLDTIEEIDAAYEQIAKRETRALIIDLRENTGGAFAARPLVAQILSDELDVGAFVSRRWADANDRAPTLSDVGPVEPWQGWSVIAFWHDLQTEPLIRLRFSPAGPVYSGPVYVLISHKTASAAELAVDALKASGRAMLIGESTAGEMLSQTIFDVPQGLQLALPIGDYYAFHSGRIEGRGIAPDVEVDASLALQAALDRTRRQ